MLGRTLASVFKRLNGRTSADALLSEGETLERASRYREALSHYEKASESYPEHPPLLEALGRSRLEARDFAGACEAINRAIANGGGSVQAFYLLGNALSGKEDYDAAYTAFSKALEGDPNHARARNNLGILLMRSGNIPEAAACFRQALDCDPSLTEAHANLGIILAENGDFNGAVRQLRQAIDLGDSNILVRANLGLALRELGDLDGALAVLETALRDAPQDALLLKNMALVVQDQGDYSAGIRLLDRCLEVHPADADAHFARSLLLLAQGNDYVTAWEDYEHRLRSLAQPPYPFRFPRWDGQQLDHERLIITAEQGIGDEIMFAGCFRDVLSRARRVDIVCADKLVALFKRSFRTAMIVPQSVALQREAAGWRYDYQIPVASLGRLFRRQIADFPMHTGYLRVNEATLTTWRERLQRLGPGLKVGIAWSGGTLRTRAQLRSIPLSQWEPVLRSPGCRFVSLQYRPEESERNAVSQALGIRIEDWGETLDYDATAALVAGLDLVISVQTAAVHLAGAMNVPVWGLISACPEWRYGINGPSMPWYPSVTLFRQVKRGAWNPVLSEVGRRLSVLAANKK